MAMPFVKHEQRGRYPEGKGVVLEGRAMTVPHEEVDKAGNAVRLVGRDVTAVVGDPSRLSNAGIVADTLD
jgi:hypothetical protein